MAPTTEQQNHSSSNGSNSNEDTLYDIYQKSIPRSPSEKKPSKGKFHNFVNNCFKKDQRQGEVTDAAPPATTAAAAPIAGGGGGGGVLDGNVTQNNTGEGSSSRERTPKTYKYPHVIRGFEQDGRSLEIMLLKGGNDNSFKTIGVVGMPAVGKTTLCWLILQNERVKSSYDKKIWVRLSQQPIAEQTLQQRGVPADVMKEISERKPPELNDALNQELENNKYLIVLDEEEENEDSCSKIQKFIRELPKEKGGAVILSCRSEEKAKKMVEDEKKIELHRLKPLSDLKSCWLIYSDAVKDSETDVNDIPSSKDVMEELLNKCGGLPGAAEMMGKIKHAQQQQKNSTTVIRSRGRENSA